MIVEFEHLVGQPVEQVFALMADIERRPEWVTPAVESRSALERHFLCGLVDGLQRSADALEIAGYLSALSF